MQSLSAFPGAEVFVVFSGFFSYCRRSRWSRDRKGEVMKVLFLALCLAALVLVSGCATDSDDSFTHYGATGSAPGHCCSE